MGRRRPPKVTDAEAIAAYWLSFRIINLILDNDDTPSFRRYFRSVLRINSGIVHKMYDEKAKRGNGPSGRMDMDDQIKDLFDTLCNSLLPRIMPKEYVDEIRADFADGMAAAEEPTRYVSLRDLDDGYEVTADVPDHLR